MKSPTLVFFLVFILFAVDAAQDVCPSIRERARISPGNNVCCDGIIKNVVETGMSTLDLFGGTGAAKTLGVIVKTLHQFVQKHFGTPFEIIMSTKNFQLNTHYNGTKMCKFKSRNYILAVYETPGNYDINSPQEKVFSNFAVGDTLRVPDISSIANNQHIGNIGNIGDGVLGGGFFG